MKKLISLAMVAIMLLGLMPTAFAEETTTYNVIFFKWSKSDSLYQLNYIDISNTNTEVKKGDSYTTTFSPNRDTIEIDSLVVIMGKNTPVYPTKNDDGSYLIDISKVTGDICIAVSIRDIGQEISGGHGYNYYIKDLSHVSSEDANNLKESYSDIATTEVKSCGTYIFSDTFTPDEGYEITYFKAYTSDNFGNTIEELTTENTGMTGITINEDGTYEIKAGGEASVYVTAVAEPIGSTTTKPTDPEPNTKLSSSQEFCDAVNQYIIDIGLAPYYLFEKDENGNYIGKYTTDTISGAIKNYAETEDYVIFGISGVMCAESHETIGDYIFNCNVTFDDSKNPCGYFVYKDGKLYSIRDAVNKSVMDVETLASVIPNTTKVGGDTDPEPTTTPEPTTVNVQSLKLSKTNLVLNKGTFAVVNAKVNPTNATNKAVTWKSSNTKVAKVTSDGDVLAVGKGNCTITATSKANSKIKATCKVTVRQPVTKVKLSKTAVNVRVGKTYTLTAKVTPTNANNKKVSWKSSKSKIAKVNQNGKVTALKKGTTVITATAKDGSGKSAKCTVKVTK
jgi:hypothetical protein